MHTASIYIHGFSCNCCCLCCWCCCCRCEIYILRGPCTYHDNALCILHGNPLSSRQMTKFARRHKCHVNSRSAAGCGILLGNFLVCCKYNIALQIDKYFPIRLELAQQLLRCIRTCALRWRCCYWLHYLPCPIKWLMH